MLSHRRISIVCFVIVVALAGGVAHADLIGHWPLDEGQGSVAFDATDNGNDGTLRGDPEWVPGVSKSALQFDADDDIDCGNAPILNLTGPLSIAVWIKPDKDESGTIAPLCKATSGAGGWSWQLRYGWSSPQPYMGFQFNAANGRIWVYANENMAVGEWQHLAAAHDGSVVKCYLNGVETDSADMGQITAGADAPFYIGQDGWDDNWEGALDDVRLYDHGLSPDEVIAAMLGSPPELSANPIPENEASDVLRDGLLAWAPGEFAATHNVYLGTSFEDVNSSTQSVVSGLDVNSFDPGRLDFGQTYFWRVDEVNGTPDKTVFKGNVWSFQVEPYSIQIPGSAIAATASSSSNEFSTPEKTINGSGLEGDFHSTSPEDMWFTATVDLDPWVQFEFDGIRQLDSMKVWNSNGAAEMALGWGVMDVVVEYSVDGENWEVLAGATQFSRAPGLPTYDQYDEIAFGGVAAKAVRLNIASNWGGILMSYSLSEVQFYMIPAVARQPVPASGSVDVIPDSAVAWRAGREAAQHTIYVSGDEVAVTDGSAPSATSSTNSLDLTPLDLQLGTTYYWRVDEVNEGEAAPVWAGPVWSFTTASALVVDDFENYSN
ncbi:MAG: discoidin domain-containing protein, partial [Phycisphaeraceae bacterium]|nr:discoidin domain-containing protein [Phycisphaeraceae bacterium]